MTSKEALNEMSRYIGELGGGETLEEEYIIERDLEVLEILKKYYISDGWSNGGVIKFWEMNNKELNKIKERLENEN